MTAMLRNRSINLIVIGSTHFIMTTMIHTRYKIGRIAIFRLAVTSTTMSGVPPQSSDPHLAAHRPNSKAPKRKSKKQAQAEYFE